MINKNKILLSLALLTSVLMFSCTKDKINTPNQLVSLFSGPTGSASYFVTDDSEGEFKIPVGLTQIPGKDIKIEFTVSSPSGAVQGQQYTLAANSITIPAGKTVDTIHLKGLFDGYANSRKDTLVFKITGGDIPALASNDSYKVYVQKYCDVVLEELEGKYTNSLDVDEDDDEGDQYETNITAISTGKNTAKLKIKNFADGYFGLKSTDPAFVDGIEVDIDFSDPANFTTNIPTQTLMSNAFGYGKATIKANGKGTFSSCDQSFTLEYEVTVSAGSFGTFTTVINR